MVLVPEHTLQRLEERKRVTTAPLTQTIRRLDSEMEQVLKRRDITDDEKATLYNQVLQRYLSYYEQKRNYPLKVSFSTPGAKETNEQAVEIQDADKNVTSDNENDEFEEQIIRSLPKTVRQRGKLLLDTIKRNLEVMKWNKSGQLVYEDKTVPASHIADLIGDSMKERMGVEPIAWERFLRGLAKMNVPEELIRNEGRRKVLREFKSRLAEGHSSQRWLPSPPPPPKSIATPGLIKTIKRKSRLLKSKTLPSRWEKFH